MNLQEQIDVRRKEINSDRLSMSIGELAGLYERGELDIHPKFQRFLRWSDEQKTKLIESILLRIPIPPIFVAQDKDGRWEVVDGMQRLGTIFQFLGVLRDPEGNLKKPLVLSETKLLPLLKGRAFENRLDPDNAFTTPQQLDFRRSRLDLQIILKESDPSSKYELFERLNTGGSLASRQEVRNCVLVWMNESLFDWMQDLCKEDAFNDCVQISERLEEQQYRMELVLRFLAFRDVSEVQLKKIEDIGDFLDEQNRTLAANQEFDRGSEHKKFSKVFNLLNVALGADSFKKHDRQKGAFKGSFLISAYEAVALGVAHNIDRWQLTTDDATKLMGLIESMWEQPDFVNYIGIGVPARERIRKSIPFGRKHFVP